MWGESNRQIIDPSQTPSEDDEIDIDSLQFIQNQPSFFNKFLCLHHIKVAARYICDINNKNLFRYSLDYQKFIPTTKLRDMVLLNNEFGANFNLFNKIINLQSLTLTIIVGLCLLASTASVVLLYYQQSLIQSIINQQSKQQYKWFGIMVGLILIRFLIFNYLISLTHNLALNVKVQLQNFYMRVIFFVQDHELQSDLHRMKYLSIESIIQAIMFLPYYIVSFLIVIGLIVLIFIQDGYYGFIILGLFLVMLVLMLMVMGLVYHRLKSNDIEKQKREKATKLVFFNLISIIFQNKAIKKIMNHLINLKNKELLNNRFINISFAICQFLGDSSVMLAIIVYYGLQYTNNIHLTQKDVYLTAVYLGLVYHPFKIFIYGTYMGIKAMQSYFSIMQQFYQLNKRKIKQVNKDIISHNYHAYSQNLGDCFNYAYEQFRFNEVQSQISSSSDDALAIETIQSLKDIQLTLSELELHPGDVIMLYSATNSTPHIETYLQTLVHQISRNQTLAFVKQRFFVLPESFQQNILLYSQLQQQKYSHILQVVELGKVQKIIDQHAKDRMNYRIARYYTWYQVRMQLARALYNDVDFLIINRFIVVQDRKLMQNVIEERKRKQKITIIVNSWSFDQFELADKIIVFQANNKELGTYSELNNNPNSLFSKIRAQVPIVKTETRKKQITLHLTDHFLTIHKSKKNWLNLSRSVYTTFFSYTHKKGLATVFLIVNIPTIFKIYVNYLIGQSTKRQIFVQCLIFGLIFLTLILLRGIALSEYMRRSSSKLFQKICDKHSNLNANQILQMYKSRSESIEVDFRKIDNDLMINFEVGYSLVLEGYISAIILSIGSTIYLAISLPVLIITLTINIIYAIKAKALAGMKQKTLQELRNFVMFCTSKSRYLLRYGRFHQIERKFYQINRLSILFTCNEMWLISGMRMLGECVVITGIIIFLLIMIQTQGNDSSNLPMVSLGVSMFINNNFTYRFNLKIYSMIGAQMISLAKCMNSLDIESQQESNSPKIQQINLIQTLESIEYKDININFGSSKCQNINLKLTSGERIAISYDNKIMANIPLYLLKKQLLDRQFVTGQMIINGKEVKQFSINSVVYLHQQPLVPHHGSVFQVCVNWKEDLIEKDCQDNLNCFFQEAEIQKLFSASTSIRELTNSHKQILQIFRVLNYQKCQLLILISALDDVDIVTRIKIQKYLVLHSKIPIIISLIMLPELFSLYPRHVMFKDGTFTEITQNKEKNKEKEN